MIYKNAFSIDDLTRRTGYPVSTYVGKNKKFGFIMATQISQHFGKNLRLICMGSSGSIFATMITMLLPNHEIEIYYVKKQGEHSHGSSVEYIRNVGDESIENIIVDDFISSGETIRVLYHEFKKSHDLKIHGLIVSGYLNPNYNQFRNMEIETLIAGMIEPPNKLHHFTNLNF